MKTSIATVRVTCPKCSTPYAEQYLPGCAIPEETGFENNYSDDCVMATCPNCDHRISIIVQMTSPVERVQTPGERKDP
ncbi:hypothetical protein [Methanoregula sp.]|uniref:hypothetical protein n=1 Tax=Methanoregula sp. TaxID=2052170 RepID=UPI0035681E22